MALIECAQDPGSTGFGRSVESDGAWLERSEHLDPQLLRGFLASARCGCFMQAARSLNLKATVLRRQLAQLEIRLDRALFVCQGHALTLSHEGRQLQARLLAQAAAQPLPQPRQPRVRLAVAAPLLHDILARDLNALLRRNAQVRLDIVVVDEAVGAHAQDADIVLWLGPEVADAPSSLMGQPPRRLAQIDHLPHIAKRYSRSATRPTAMQDLDDFMLVQWMPDARVEGFQSWNRLIEQRPCGVVRVEGYEVTQEMIRSSACIGLLPGYMASFDRALTALPGVLSEPLSRYAWLAVRDDERAEVALIAELILSSFQARAEWFAPA